MNDKKIAVIALCDPDEPAAIRPYLDALDVPHGYEVELIEVCAAGSTAAACQQAMEKTDAKYKVYLAPGSILIRLTFFQEMLCLFAKDPAIGIIGLIGTPQLSTTGELVMSPHIVGNVLYTDDTSFHGDPIAGEMEDVMAVSDYLIATQYDIPWRSDLFHEDSFWAEAQCIEFRRRGYRTVVPRQEEAWLIAEPREICCDEVSRSAFLDTYSKDIYPLVSIIMLTYQRPNYFRMALESVLTQTYRNLDIFITDDSHDTVTAEMMQRDFSDDPRIHYEHHPTYGAAENWTRAMQYNHPRALYVNWLMDDDLFMPDKIAVMMDCFFAHPDISLVTSYRDCIDADGNRMPTPDYAKPICSEPTKFDGASVGMKILLQTANFIGEPTTVLAKKALMLDGYRLGFTGEEGKYLSPDFPTWLHLLARGNMMYLTEPLSQFRIHEGNGQWNPDTFIIGIIGWAICIRAAIEQDVFLRDNSTRKTAITQWMDMAFVARGKLGHLIEAGKEPVFRDFQIVFNAMSEALKSDCHIEFSIDTTLELLPMDD